MNKELIKQLEGVGFNRKAQAGNLLCRVAGGMSCAYYVGLNEFTISNRNLPPNANVLINIKSPTFKQILAAIKEHTGVDLQPKKTKTQRIEALEEQIKHISKYVKATSTLVQDLEVLKNNVSDIYKQQAGDINSLRNVVLQNYDKVKTLIKKEQELRDYIGRLEDTQDDHQKRLEPLEAMGRDLAAFYGVDLGNGESETKTIKISLSKNEHAPAESPKELKLGGWAEVVGSGASHSFKIGETVLVGCMDELGNCVCHSESAYFWISKEDLKLL